MVFTGNANPALAEKVVKKLCLSLGQATVGMFSDGEIAIELNENVRGKDVFIIQSTCQPTNNNLMELILMADALRLFDIPVDNVYGSPVLLGDIKRQAYINPIVVSPDVGGVVRARAVAKQLNTELAIIDKRREKANESQVMHIIGDVTDRTCIIVDDMCDTAGTLCRAADALKEHGAAKIVAYATHPVLSGGALENLKNSSLDELIVTDTIPLSPEIAAYSGIRQLSLADLLAESIRRVCNEESISAMFL
jgi:ribose-phosphate pyrophosphokinase